MKLGNKMRAGRELKRGKKITRGRVNKKEERKYKTNKLQRVMI